MFHKLLKEKKNKLAICEIVDTVGANHTGQEGVAAAVVKHFFKDLGR